MNKNYSVNIQIDFEIGIEGYCSKCFKNENEPYKIESAYIATISAFSDKSEAYNKFAICEKCASSCNEAMKIICDEYFLQHLVDTVLLS